MLYVFFRTRVSFAFGVRVVFKIFCIVFSIVGDVLFEFLFRL